MRTNKSYMIVISYFKLYPALPPLNGLYVYQTYRLSGEMLFLKRFVIFTGQQYIQVTLAGGSHAYALGYPHHHQHDGMAQRLGTTDVKV